ncbi:MAG TPA: TfoX/Sxy family protein [Amaricoccus sp.]|nr:TfoX/Sxy family protein [Amaricoccus sp.]
MSVSPATRAFVLELFDDLGGVTARAMMGGLMLYRDGRVFALVSSGERIYIKAAGGLAEALAAAGGEQFRPTRRDGVTAGMGYWSLPEAALDEPDTACDWARRALDATAD